MKSIAVFCGSRAGEDSAFSTAARGLARLLAERGIGVVYGGGSVGLMGILADAALEAGGRVVGVIPRTLWEREVGHSGLTENHIVETMHERKKLISDLSDGFIALPGAVGTLDEFFECWTWGQLGVHDKPFGMLNVTGYFDPLIGFLRQVVETGFMVQKHMDMVQVDEDPAALLAKMTAYVAPKGIKWVTPEEV